jgi:Peptidase A4 family
VVRGLLRRPGQAGLVVAATALFLVLVASPALAAGKSRSAPQPSTARSHAAPAPKHKFGRGTSTNWSGYAVNGTGATHVIGTWTQPTARCAAGENSWSSPWVGIDGNTSNTVEQIGTDTDCQNGTPLYYAWYEMYPKSLVTVSMAVRPGDSFTGEVTNPSAGKFVLKLTNNTTHATFSTTQLSKKARRTSVEWIMEGPSNGLLTNFGSVPFGAASATISNTTANLGSFGNAQSITMVNGQGVTRAVPSAVSGGSSFSVSWQHG